MVDKISMQILQILQEKARIPNVEVSRKVGLAPSAVLERIRKMEKQGVIDGYEVRLNPERFNMAQIAFTYISVANDKFKQVATRLTKLDEILEVHFVAGSDCLLAKIRCEDPEALGALLRDKIHPIAGVKGTRSETVLSTIKETTRIPLPKNI